jgi:hypothetical protein
MPADCLGMGIRRWDRKIGVTRIQTEPSHEIALDKPLLHPTHPLLVRSSSISLLQTSQDQYGGEMGSHSFPMIMCHEHIVRVIFICIDHTRITVVCFCIKIQLNFNL